MLHFETISPSTLELLRELQKIEILKELRLVGGTSLALQYGHRKSIDIDLFGSFDTDEFELLEKLRIIGEVKTLQKSQNIFVYLLNGVKIDIVRYNFIWLEEALHLNGLKLAGRKDIAAMKFAAITGRGTRKDFVDIWFLLEEYSLKEMVSFYLEKFPDANEFLLLKSLGYYVDAESEPMPYMIKAVTWDTIKDGISKKLNDYISNG